MIYIFVLYGKVVSILNDDPYATERFLIREKDYTVEYLPKKKWITPKLYGEEGDSEKNGHVTCTHPGKPHEK